jgi:dihydroflavonol-4-reductase
MPSHFGKSLKDMAARRLPMAIEGGFNFTDVRDVVAGALVAAEKGRKGESYLLGGKWWSIKEIYQEIGKIIGKPVPSLVLPMSVARIAGFGGDMLAAVSPLRPAVGSASLHALRTDRQISHAKAEAELGYRPRPFEETLRDTLKWFEDR